MATILQISDSVTAQLNAAELSQPFHAQRLYVPDFDLEDMKELRVSVVPRELYILAHDRTTSKYNACIDVAVQRKFDSGSNAEIDAYLDAIEAESTEQAEEHLDRFARHVHDQAKALSKKDYSGMLDRSPEFVVMFIPGDQFIDAALARRPELLEFAAQVGVGQQAVEAGLHGRSRTKESG